MGADEHNELNPLQMFLLLLVDFGLTTPYDLLSKAGLGVGLTSPALKRLEQAGLLTSTPGPRRRVRYAMTEKGETTLMNSVLKAHFWQYGQTDVFESLPRGIILAWATSDLEEAQKGVARAAGNLLLLARKRKREAEDLRDSVLRLQAEILERPSTSAKGQLIAMAFRWLRAEAEATQFRLQADAVQGMGKLIFDLPPAPHLHD